MDNLINPDEYAGMSNLEYEVYLEKKVDENPMVIFDKNIGQDVRSDVILFNRALANLIGNNIDVGAENFRSIMPNIFYLIHNSEVALNYFNNHVDMYNVTSDEIMPILNEYQAMYMVDNKIYTSDNSQSLMEILTDFDDSSRDCKKIFTDKFRQLLEAQSVFSQNPLDDDYSIGQKFSEKIRKILDVSISEILNNNINLTNEEFNDLVSNISYGTIFQNGEQYRTFIDNHIEDNGLYNIRYNFKLPDDVLQKLPVVNLKKRVDFFSQFDSDNKSFFGANQDAGNVLLNFGIIESSEFKRLKNKLVSQGMSNIEAEKTLRFMNSTGICTYADIANIIFLNYKDNPQQFEKDFGYSMYTKVKGKNRLNSSELLLDMFTYLNSNKYNAEDTRIFNYDDGRLSINNFDTKNQVYCSSGILGISETVVNSFLHSKSETLNFVVDDVINHFTNQEKYDIKLLKDTINQNLSHGNEIGLGVFYEKEQGKSKQNKIRLYSGDTIKNETLSFHTTISSGHAITVLGTNEYGVVVSSWGEMWTIPYQDLSNGIFTMSITKFNMGGVK